MTKDKVRFKPYCELVYFQDDNVEHMKSVVRTKRNNNTCPSLEKTKNDNLSYTWYSDTVLTLLVDENETRNKILHQTNHPNKKLSETRTI